MTERGGVERTAFAIEAAIELTGGDARAIGAAITTDLCGSWRHEGPCRWPHNTRVVGSDGRSIRTRTVIVAPPADRPEVVERAERALRTGRIEPAGTDVVAWRMVEVAAGPLQPDERDLAGRLGGVTPT